MRISGTDLDYTPLFLAVKANHGAVTEALLKAGADPKIEDENGDPVMVYASDRKLMDQARILIAHGISIDSRNSGGITALLRGVPYEEAEDIQAKIDLGANPDLTDGKGNTPLMRAAASGNFAAIEVLIKAGAKPDSINESGKTALLLAVSSDVSFDEKKVPEVVKRLIQGGANPNIRDAEGRTALITALASYRSTPGTIRAILDAKPDVAIRDNDGRDALFHAVLHERGKAHLAHLLALGADLRTTDTNDTDLLMMAAAGNDPEQVRFFLERGLTPDRKTKSGSMPVHYALRAGHWNSEPSKIEQIGKRTMEILKLFNEKGASLGVANADGDTLLHLAAMSGSTDVVAYLLPFFEHPALVNSLGETPLHLAAAASAEVVDQLLPRYPDPDVRDLNGNTALMNAGAADNRDSLARLLQAGANIDALDRAGISVLSEAVSANNSDKTRFLIECGASPETLYLADSELLRIARLFHEQPVKADEYAYLVGLLAGCAKDINSRDSAGMTALMWVAASNNRAALDAVLKCTPDLQLRSPDGRTAMMWAACSRAEIAMKALREAGADATLRDSSGRTAQEWLAWSKTQAIKTSSTKGEDSLLLESLTKGREAVLQNYLRQKKWTEDDRIGTSPPLHLAAALGNVDAVQDLLKDGAPRDQLADDRSTPLMEAATNGRTEVAQFLLDHGANPSLRNASGERAVDLAVYMRQVESARLFLRAAKSISPDESQLLAALAGMGDEDLLRDFLKAGASIPPIDKRPADHDPFARGNQPTPEAPLVAAVMRKDNGLLKILAEFPAASGADDPRLLSIALHTAAENGFFTNLRFLIEDCKADPDILLSDSLGGVTRVGSSDGKGEKFVDGYSPLSRALEQGHLQVVRYLVDRGAAIIGRTRGGLTPLTYVIQHQQPELLELFLKNKAPTSLVDLDGSTALHVAAAADDETATRLLLDHGADPEAKDVKGRTPLEIAGQNKAAKTTVLLENRAK